MSKENRIEIALSRIPNEVYQCPICKVEHFYQVNASKKVMVIPPKQAEPKPEKKEKRKKENKPEQLALF